VRLAVRFPNSQLQGVMVGGTRIYPAPVRNSSRACAHAVMCMLMAPRRCERLPAKFQRRALVMIMPSVTGPYLQMQFQVYVYVIRRYVSTESVVLHDAYVAPTCEHHPLTFRTSSYASIAPLT
jgi:hypothetical protein